MFGKFLICLVISKAAAYGVCPYHVECIPGCIKLDEKGCKTCACGPMMFHPGAGYHGMPGGSMGGASFKPGQMGDGNLFGNLMGGGHQPAAKPTEKPLKECTGTMLCIMTCKGHYSLSDTVGSNGCRSCTCPKEHHETQTTVVVEKPKPKPQVVQQVVVAKPVTHPDCTGTKLCMMTCKGKYILGEHGKDGCQSCACVPEPEPAHVQVVHTKPKEECHETVICMLSCQHGYTISNPCNTGCQDKCQKCECKAPPKPQVIQVVEPPPKTIECPKAIECMSTCEHGYQLGHRGSDGCPQCNCLAPPKQQVIIYEVKCPQALSCSRGCSVGYRCDKNGCPTCGCIEPQVIGVTTIKEVYTTQAVTCQTALRCTKACNLGYKRGNDGCPVCECCQVINTVTSTQPVRPVQPQVTSGVTTLIKQCPATLQCMSTCSHGYTLGTEGRDGCPTCTCISPATSECHNTCEKKPAITVHSCDSVIHCMASCNNYHLGATGSDGCPVCTCADTCKTGCQETTHEIVQLVTSSGCQDRSCESTCTDCAKGQVVQVVSGASTSVGGGATGGGMATGGGALTRGGGGGMTGGGEQCPPLPPNCHPWCIKYDAAHCRLCQCESHSDSGYSG